MALLDKLLANMKDDKGLFQGGEYARPLGRLKDALGMKPSMKTLKEPASKTPLPSEEPASMELAPATGNRMNYLVSNFDPTSNESVMELQKALNSSGVLRGAKLSEDGIFGKKTLAAVRDIQNTRNDVLSGRGDNRLIGPRLEDGSFREGYDKIAVAESFPEKPYLVDRPDRKVDWRN